MHGASFICFICIINPVDKINLQTVTEDCHFADKELDQMTESEKRCMIYWWYATNIFQFLETINVFSYLIVLFVLWDGCFQNMVEITMALDSNANSL